MKALNIILIGIVALLSIAAGLAKVLQTPQEMDFLQGIGLTPTLIMIFGAIQFSGGLGVLYPPTRVAGAILALLAFAASVVLLFIGGKPAVAVISLIPLALAVVVLMRALKKSS